MRIRKEIFVIILILGFVNLGLFAKLNDNLLNLLYGLTMGMDILVIKERYDI